MEYCGGGSVSDIMHALGHGLNEQQIAVICHEALNVRMIMMLLCDL